MLNPGAARGFSLIEALVALLLMLAGLAGGGLLLLQSLQHERVSSERRAAIRLAASLADELRAMHPGNGQALTADAPVIANWVAAAEATLPTGSRARVEVRDAQPAVYRITIEWPMAGVGMQQLLLPVTL